jgi:hypothetical protein
MIRCPWCKAENVSIDTWCTSCARYLDWSPSSDRRPLDSIPAAVMTVGEPAPAGKSRRRVPGLVILLPAAAAGVAALILALPVAGRFGAAIPALPKTALAPMATPSLYPEATPAPQVVGTPEPVATAEPTAPAIAAPSQARTLPGTDPTRAVARFYQALSAHQFGTAANLWTARMQAQYPPAQYINHRFSATQQIGLRAGQLLGRNGNQAVVYVDVVERIGGQTRRWVGTWQLVATGSGWLLNQPNLRAG